MQLGGAPYPCSKCRSNEWASTREMISATPKAVTGWRKWIKTPPPSWSALRAFNAFVLVFCAALAVVENNWWIMMFDAFIAGTAASGIYHATKMIRMEAILDQMKHAFESMADINKALVEGEVSVLMQRIADDEDAPIAPNKLH
jgi:hypothetical protein